MVIRKHEKLSLVVSVVVVVVWWCFIISPCLGDKLTHDDQCSALLQFKEGMNKIGGSSKVATWDSSLDCCSWNGVTCNATTANVIGLDLSNSYIDGELSSDSSLFRLVHLQILNLSNNSFSSQIPSSFGRLTSLSHLNLSSVGLSGQIPKEISLLKNLVSLDLSSHPFYNRNDLKLEDPNLRTLVQNLSRLRELHLNHVNMAWDVDKDWCEAVSSALPELQVLSLSGTGFLGPITRCILNFPLLTRLYLDRTYINEIPRDLFSHSNLRVLDMSYSLAAPSSLHLPDFPQNTALQHLLFAKTNLSGNLPNSICNLKSLRKLDLHRCNLSGLLPSTLGNLTQLVYLDLSINNFSGHIQFSFEQFDHLEYLDLSVNNFSGHIPLMESSSQSITYIDLSNNRFTGPIPTYYANELPNLNLLKLEKNSLSGQIPPSLFILPSLRELYLNENRLTGQLQEFLHASSSSSLSYVDLSINELHGSIPTSFFKIPSLMYFYLNSNNFSGTIDPQLFENLTNLSELDLSNNTLLSIKTGVIIPQMPSLELFYFSCCSLSEFPEFLRNQQQLFTLDLSKNKIQGKIPKWVWTMRLNHLNLSHNLLNDFERPLPILLSSSMAILDVGNNSIQGTLPMLPPSLDFLSVSNNNLTGEISPSICNMKRLSSLDLSNNRMSGTMPPCLGNLSSRLSILNVRGNNFHGMMPQDFAEACGLYVLNFSDNQLEGTVPKSLANCTNLRVIDLGNNQLNDEFPQWLESFSWLQVLVLQSNRLHGTLKPPIFSSPFSELQIIDLSENNFSGNLPSEYFQCWSVMMTATGTDYDLEMTARNGYYGYSIVVTNKGQKLQYVASVISMLKVVDLSSNRFEGELPASIGFLKSLIVLNLSRNSLTGEIPFAMGNLTALQSLDLSHNKLSGSIPSELKSLTFLSVLNLSWNFLTGMIPNGGQLDTFSANQFEGNAGLCGLPLLNKCQHDSVSPSIPQIFDTKTEDEFGWMFILMGYGSGLAIGVVIEHFVLWRNRFYFIKLMRIGSFLQDKNPMKTRKKNTSKNKNVQ